MRHYILDIEGLATQPQAVLLSVGGVEFDPLETPELGCLLEARTMHVLAKIVDQDSREIDPLTMNWWMKQGEMGSNFIQSCINEGYILPTVLENVSSFLDWRTHEKRVWANGTQYDIAVLESCYRDCGMECPWRYNEPRCMRTLRELVPDSVSKEKPDWPDYIEHNARHDAIVQAWQVQNILRYIRGV